MNFLKRFAYAVVGVFGFIFILGSIVGPQQGLPHQTASVSGLITLAKYKELRDGMSYYGATEILGRDGVEDRGTRLTCRVVS